MLLACSDLVDFLYVCMYCAGRLHLHAACGTPIYIETHSHIQFTSKLYPTTNENWQNPRSF